MNKQDALARLDSLENEAAELRKIINEPEQWEPKGGDWYVNHNCVVAEAFSYDECAAAGREFQTEKQAKSFAKADRAFGRLWQFALEQNGDWESMPGNETKGFPYWLHLSDNFDVLVFFKTIQSRNLFADMLNDGRLVL